MLKKVVIVGSESTGKSTLCSQLAAHYDTLWCPEYARDYLTQQGMNYSFDDLSTIAKGHIALENEFTEKAEKEGKPVLFIDTDMYVMKVWCEYVFGKCHSFISDEIAKRKYDLYLLCNIDLPWYYDPLREYPDEQPRIDLLHIYKHLMQNQRTPWILISGNYEERISNAVKAVELYLFNNPS